MVHTPAGAAGAWFIQTDHLLLFTSDIKFSKIIHIWSKLSSAHSATTAVKCDMAYHSFPSPSQTFPWTVGISSGCDSQSTQDHTENHCTNKNYGNQTFYLAIRPTHVK